MEVTGELKRIGETKTFGTSGFRKRECVVTTDEKYPQHILIEFVQDKVSLLDPFAVGQMVKVGINLQGREWTNPEGEVKYFNSIQGWRIDEIQLSGEPEQATQEEDRDDLPF